MNAAVRLAALLLAPSLAAAAPQAPTAPEPGVQWEQTVEMQMSGFSMPAQTVKVCVPKKGMTEPPGSGRKDDACKVTSLRNDGKKMSWSMVCEKEKVTGEGEIVQGADGYDGKMTMRSPDGEMFMKLRGKKLGGDCDAAEMRRKADAMRAEGTAQVAKGCRDMAEKLLVHAFSGTSPMCTDPADRRRMCERGATRDGVRTLSGQPELRKDFEATCATDLATLTAKACPVAGKDEAAAAPDADGDEVLTFIGHYCPAESQVLAQRECAGRTYTKLSSRYRSFCTSFAGNLLDSGKKPAAQPKEPAKPEGSIQDAAKKAAKGFLPF
jgi:hypothetical protein